MNTIHVFYIKQTEKLSDEIFQQFLLQLPNSIQQEINGYKHWQSAQASLLGKMLLLNGFKVLNLNYSLHDIRVGLKDRPFINDSIDFNISHSGEYVMVAIAVNARVGIDIEKHRKLDVQLFRKYFDDMEWNEILAASDSRQTFFELWSIKESAIKCDGRGVEILSDTHVIRSETDHLKSAGKVKCATSTFSFKVIETDMNYSTCVTSDEAFSTIIHQLQLPDLG